MYLDLLLLSFPELVIVITALAVLAADVFALRDIGLSLRFRLAAILSCVGALIACASLFTVSGDGEFMQGMLVSDSIGKIAKAAILILLIGTCLLSADHTFTEHSGEYFAVLLLGTSGMMFLVSAEDLLMIFLALELTSLCLYILAGFDKRQITSAEAALKYFLFGGTAAAFTLFGLSLLYGVSGHLYLPQVAAGLCRQVTSTGIIEPVVVLGIVMTLVGFAFKIAAAPFHLWAPDVYQGAPLPAAAFIASGSKVASFLVLGRVLLVGFQGSEGGVMPLINLPGWMTVLTILATVSLLVGNLAAIAQSSVRRLLAYSAVAHAGYMLLAFFSSGEQGLSSLLYYAITYAISTLGAFGVVAIVENTSSKDGFEAFAGLGQRSPLMALCLLVFILSLAGIPPLAGFFGKFYVFASALATKSGMLDALWVVVLAIAMSAVSLYYYLRILKYVYVFPVYGQPVSLPLNPLTRATVGVCALLTVMLGCLPQLLLGPLSEAVRSAGF